MSVALAFAPFDVAVDFATHRLRETLGPLAEVLGLGVDDLVKQWVAARPTALHFHKQETNLKLVLSILIELTQNVNVHTHMNVLLVTRFGA